MELGLVLKLTRTAECAELIARCRIARVRARLRARIDEMGIPIARLARRSGVNKVTIHRLRAKYGTALREEVRETGLGDGDVDEELRYLLTLL